MGVEDDAPGPTDQPSRDGDRMNLHEDVRATSQAAPPVQPPLILEVMDAVHRFGDVVALDQVTVTARAGEFLTILGESGSGKTTLLRIISGLERPSEIGRLAIAGQDVAALPASRRNCTTVFQNYALFPHMSVGENVEYGLKVRGVTSEERRTRALEALQLVRLGHTHGRRIHQLSGGERQRVALARALVTRPAILLLDEPLGALDEKLRLDMQVELLDLHNKLGMTFVYITHSQEEALTMSDRIILMSKGRIAQEGPPRELFDRPRNRFVADFMGVENLLEGRLLRLDAGRAAVRVGDCDLVGVWSGGDDIAVGAMVCVGVRAERLHFGGAAGQGVNRIRGRPAGTIYKGKYLDQTVDSEIGSLKARVWESSLDAGGIGELWWRDEDCMVMQS